MRPISLAVALMAVCALFALSPQRAYGDTISLTYTGIPFTTATSPYTTSDFVTITIELAAALPPSLTPLTAVTPLSFSASDGIQTITNNSTPDPFTTDVFQFTTNAQGEVLTWNVVVGTAASSFNPALGGLISSHFDPNDPFPISRDYALLFNGLSRDEVAHAEGFVDIKVCLWCNVTPMVEPSSLILLTSGLAAFGIYMRKRKPFRA